MYNHHYYNKNLKEFARELRSESVSKAEKRIWKAFLSRKQFKGLRFLRQRPIDYFIVDFFCPELKLIIEIDGNSHFQKPLDGKITDAIPNGVWVGFYGNDKHGFILYVTTSNKPKVASF